MLIASLDHDELVIRTAANPLGRGAPEFEFVEDSGSGCSTEFPISAAWRRRGFFFLMQNQRQQKGVWHVIPPSAMCPHAAEGTSPHQGWRVANIGSAAASPESAWQGPMSVPAEPTPVAVKSWDDRRGLGRAAHQAGRRRGTKPGSSSGRSIIGIPRLIGP